MPNLIINLTATTELQAINAMLAAIGSAPITDLTVGQALSDVAMATEELRKAAREVQTVPWQFNTRFQHALSPVGTVAWTDADGTANTLNVFTPPTNLASFRASPVSAQVRSGRVMDLVIGTSVVYVPGTQVFIDRTFYREGLIAGTYAKLFIDATFLFDFATIPETARRYITVLAGRRFAASVVGASETVGFAQQDEVAALRILKRDQGMEDNFNMLDNPDVGRAVGLRPRMIGVTTDFRRGR